MYSNTQYSTNLLGLDLRKLNIQCKAKKKSLVSGNPTDPTFLGPTQIFFGTSENFSCIFRVFLMIFTLFLY